MTEIPALLLFFGARDPEAETLLVGSLFLVGMVLDLVLFFIAAFFYFLDKRDRQRNGKPALEHAGALRRTPFLAEAFGSLAILCGVLFPVSAVSAHVHFGSNTFLALVPLFLLISVFAAYHCNTFSKRPRKRTCDKT